MLATFRADLHELRTRVDELQRQVETLTSQRHEELEDELVDVRGE